MFTLLRSSLDMVNPKMKVEPPKTSAVDTPNAFPTTWETKALLIRMRDRETELFHLEGYHL